MKKSTPYDITTFGVLMILSGMVDIYIILKFSDYRLPFFGIKLNWYFNFLFPVVHFAVGYGLIQTRKWVYHLFIIFCLYGIISPTINFFRQPPPHNIRTILLIASIAVLFYLRWRRPYFRN